MRSFLTLVAGGALGGLIALFVGLPLPFMMGSLLATLPLIIKLKSSGRTPYYPNSVRQTFVALIGAMIGTTVTPEIVTALPGLIPSLLAMFVFVPLANLTGYLIARIVGGYDRPTAIFAAVPGGMIEAVEMGRKAGANIDLLIAGHFLRVSVIVVLVPIGFSIWSGGAVGSASGQTLSTGDADIIAVLILIAMVPAGLILGRILRLPAPHLVGPLVISSVLNGAGLVDAASPDALLYLGQLMVGIGLANQFRVANWALIRRAFVTTFCIVLGYLAIGLVFAIYLTRITELPGEGLFLAFAPGGVSEMGLIALSLSLSPLVVTAHHVLRIFLSVIFASIFFRISGP